MSGFKNGTVKISNDVLSVIALVAANEVEGLCYVYGESLHSKDNVKTKVNNKGIRLEMEDDKIHLDMDVVVKRDAIIAEVCKNIQERVCTKVQVMTGLEVQRVNVNVLKIGDQ